MNFRKKQEKDKIKNEKKKKIKGLCNSGLLISGSISIGVRVFMLFDITLVKC